MKKTKTNIALIVCFLVSAVCNFIQPGFKIAEMSVK